MFPCQPNPLRDGGRGLVLLFKRTIRPGFAGLIFMSQIYGPDWMPPDIEAALCSDLGPAIRENFEFAEVTRPLDELHPWEAY